MNEWIREIIVVKSKEGILDEKMAQELLDFFGESLGTWMRKMKREMEKKFGVEVRSGG